MESRLEEEIDHWHYARKWIPTLRDRKEITNMYEMKLLDKILDRDNLNQAFKQVKRNKGAAGVDGMTVEELAGYLALNKEEIISQIRQRKYEPQPVLRVEIPKPNGGIRLLGIPAVIDRVIQQAIAQILTPLFDKQFNEYSYGFRPKRYAEMAGSFNKFQLCHGDECQRRSGNCSFNRCFFSRNY